MYRSSRSRVREKPHRAGDEGGARAVAASELQPVSGDRGGNSRLKKQTSASKLALDSSCRSGSSIEKNSVALEFRRRSCKKANSVPMKTLIDEDMSKEMETRHPSPSVIARLMGLDTLPPPQMVHKQKKNMDSCFQTASSVGFQEECACSEDCLCRNSTDEHQEFKDVFEVMETSKVKRHKNQPVRKRMVTSKGSDADMDLIRRKFMDAKRLSTDEVLQNSKEFNDALEVLDSNKDLFLEFLQGPDSLFTKHLHDLNCAVPSFHASHITILKSSKGTKYESGEVCSKSERNYDRFTCVQKEANNAFRKPSTRLIGCSSKDHNDSLPNKSSKSHYQGKTEASDHPTRIVVLKPSLEKVQSMAEAAPLTHQNFQLGYRRHREHPLSGIQESYMEGRYQQRLFDNVEILGHKAKGSREIAREVTKHMKRNVSCIDKKVYAPGLNMYTGSESSHILSDMSKTNNSQTTCDHFDVWSNNFSPSSSYSTESSVSREARKRLSERWKMTHQYQEVGLDARGSSTLGEMLALSDRESTLDSLVVQKVPDEKFARDEILGMWDCPLGISSKDGWKDGSSRNLTRSKSLPASSTVYGSPKLSNRKRAGRNNNCYMLKDVLNMGPDDSADGNFCRWRSLSWSSKNHSNKPQLSDSHGEENMLPEQEIHVNSEELRNSIHVRPAHPDEEKPVQPAHPDDALPDRKYLTDSSMLLGCRDVMQLSTAQEEQVQERITSTVLADNEGLSDHNQDDIVIEEQILYLQGTSTDHPQVDSLPPKYIAVESGPPVSSKECEQPSPISVLEPPSEEETSSSGCFERISADLKELRMQLRLLKLESANTCAEEEEVLMSDEDTVACCYSPLPKGSILQAFRDDDDRDFSYLLDMLIESVVHGVNQGRLSDAFYSPDFPVGPGVFDKLEKKYNVLTLWSRSERKLLFDLINSILVDLVAPCMDLQPWLVSKRCMPMWDREGLVERVWQMVVGKRKKIASNQEELVVEPRWLGTEENVDTIGREIEKMLTEDLLEELVSDFIIG